MPFQGQRLLTYPIGDWLINIDHYNSKIKFNPITGCDEWTGVCNNVGYGFVGAYNTATNKKQMVTAHRVALTMKLGRAIRSGYNCNHLCHNKRCVTAEHLEEGTQKEKLAHMKRDDILNDSTRRRRGPGGKQNNRTYRYSEEEIQWIRNAEIPDIMSRYKLSNVRAHTFRHGFRNGYQWLPWIKN